MSVAVIDPGSGNLRSVQKAFETVAAHLSGIGPILVTQDAKTVRAARRVVLPGVGAFGHCRAGIEALPGMQEALLEQVRVRQVPFLGICVGMQLMADRGREHGDHAGFGWVPGMVEPIPPTGERRIPHMGWNELCFDRDPHPVFAGLGTAPHAYFVHSFAYRPEQGADIAATVQYDGPIVAAVARENMVGTQFHPEKSQSLGQKIIANFLSWSP